MATIIKSNHYKRWLTELKAKIKSSQIKAALAVNKELMQFYWELGQSIVEKQQHNNWGSSVIDQLAKDLKREFPDLEGFSRTNLYYVKQFYIFYSNPEFIPQLGGQINHLKKNAKTLASKEVSIIPQLGGQLATIEFVPQLVGQIPWGHHKLILDKIKQPIHAAFYIQQTIKNNWSRNVLALQIDTKLHNRQGRAVTNFKTTLPKEQSDLAIQTLKDPYIFDFLTIRADAQELEIEQQLVTHITEFLLELGQGFAYMGRQYKLQVGKKEFRLDLLFYHTKLQCYVIIELKTGEFKPEHTGKLNYYLSAIDDIVRNPSDKPSIGILLCRNKETIDVEYALRDVRKPIGVSQFRFLEKLPKHLQHSLPSIKEIEKELNSYIRKEKVASSRTKTSKINKSKNSKR